MFWYWAAATLQFCVSRHQSIISSQLIDITSNLILDYHLKRTHSRRPIIMKSHASWRSYRKRSRCRSGAVCRGRWRCSPSVQSNESRAGRRISLFGLHSRLTTRSQVTHDWSDACSMLEEVMLQMDYFYTLHAMWIVDTTTGLIWRKRATRQVGRLVSSASLAKLLIIVAHPLHLNILSCLYNSLQTLGSVKVMYIVSETCHF